MREQQAMYACSAAASGWHCCTAVIQFGATAAWWRAAKGHAPAFGQLSPLNVIAGLAIFGAGQVRFCLYSDLWCESRYAADDCNE